MELHEDILGLFESGRTGNQFAVHEYSIFYRLREALNQGSVRAAQPDASSASGWRVNEWVKKGILVGFRMGTVIDMSIDSVRQPFFDKWTWPVKEFTVDSGIRIVPGGSSIRDGCYIGKGVTCMPPMYINAGAYVDDGTMIDSNALVGSCAQIGKNCHISAAAQIGGVLEPVGTLPVIVEDEVVVGGNCGVYEGVVIKRRAVLAPGVILTSALTVYDQAKEQIYYATLEKPLVIPEGAVVVPGTRRAANAWSQGYGLGFYTPIIVKYRDAKTDAKTALEESLR